MSELIKQYTNGFRSFTERARVRIFQTPLITSGLQIYYPFDKNGRDYSLNRRDLTTTYDVQFGVSPTKFNGSAGNIISGMTRSGFNGLSTAKFYESSWTGWFYFNGIGLLQLVRVAGNLVAQSVGFVEVFMNDPVTLQIRIANTPYYLAYPTGFQPGQWYHIVMNFNGFPPGGPEVTMYIDSVNIGTVQWDGTYPFTFPFDQLEIGGFDGFVDDMAFVNRMLTPLEINTIYTSNRPIRILP